jgi:hypothetical protein
MAIYRDGKHNDGVVNAWRLQKQVNEKAKKRQENKNELLLEVMHQMFNSNSDWDGFIKDLCMEALSKRTQKELKAILNGE